MNLTDLKDSHRGQVAYIFGAGPSLRHVDPASLCGVTITVNSAILKHPGCDYWLSDDQDTRNWSYFTDLVMPSKAIKFVDRDRLGRFVSEREDVVKYPHQQWYDWYNPKTLGYDTNKLSFTRDPSLPLAGTRTSVATAIHVAWIMGCEKIILLGCDCEYTEQLRYFWQFPGYRQPSRIGRDLFPNKLIRDVYGNVARDTHCEEMLDFWDAFAHVLNRHSVAVFNASGGILNSFRRIELAEIQCPIQDSESK